MKGLVLGGGLKVKKTSRKRSHLGHSQIKKALRTEKFPPGIIKKKSFENRKQSHLGHSQIKKALRTEKIPPGIIKKKEL